MAQDHGAPRAAIVNVLVTFGVEKVGSLGLFDEDGIATNGLEGPHRRVHTSGDETFRLGKEPLVGLCCHRSSLFSEEFCYPLGITRAGGYHQAEPAAKELQIRLRVAEQGPLKYYSV